MEKIVIYPKNKEHFKKLILLAKKIFKMCNENNIPFVIYGGFAHFYHTKDEKINVNDLDVLIKENKFAKFEEFLDKYNIKYKKYSAGIVVSKGKLKIEFDKMEKKYNKNKHPFFKKINKVDFYGINVNILSLKQVEEIYSKIDKVSKKSETKMLKKIKHLEEFLGRKIK